MLTLHSKNIEFSRFEFPNRGVYKISSLNEIAEGFKESKFFIIKDIKESIPSGYFGYLNTTNSRLNLKNEIITGLDFNYLETNDLIVIDPQNKTLSVIFRAKANSNTFLVTENCNHYCIMCSQPPKKKDDSFLIEDILQAIPLIPMSTLEIGLSGGEPTLNSRFLDILKSLERHLPSTAVHILSNGRNFKDIEFCKNIFKINNHNLMIGIPIYSSDQQSHNFIVQSKNAFEETIQGIINLKSVGIKVEIRIVLHKQNIDNLLNTAKYITKNLSFIDHLAFMGLEAMGFAKTNWNDLWIHPLDYKEILGESCEIASRNIKRISVYNLPFCWINSKCKEFYIKSISDWKNEYFDECNQCSGFSLCGGFFSSTYNKIKADIKPNPFTRETLEDFIT